MAPFLIQTFAKNLTIFRCKFPSWVWFQDLELSAIWWQCLQDIVSYLATESGFYKRCVNYLLSEFLYLANNPNPNFIHTAELPFQAQSLYRIVIHSSHLYHSPSYFPLRWNSYSRFDPRSIAYSPDRFGFLYDSAGFGTI